MSPPGATKLDHHASNLTTTTQKNPSTNTSKWTPPTNPTAYSPSPPNSSAKSSPTCPHQAFTP